MESKSFVSKVYAWLLSPEIFGSISKKIPGEWQLYEYYIDTEEELLNIKENRLRENQQSFEIEFFENGKYLREINLPVNLFQHFENGEWSVAKNFITFMHPENFRNNVEFQFAFEKENLKLLKKDGTGKIEFFGFFKRIE